MSDWPVTRARGPILAAVTLIVLAGVPAAAQQTVGLFLNDEDSFEGYTLYNPLNLTTSYLLDQQGRLVHEWSSLYPAGNTLYMLPDGNLLRAARYEPVAIPRFNAGGAGGRFEVFDWDGTIVWDFIYASDTFRHHHDIAPLPNGNVLMIAWELKTLAEATAAGRDPAMLPEGELWPEKIVEIEQTGPASGVIVWEWHLWDHLIQDFDISKSNFGVPGDHPELVDVNYFGSAGNPGSADWLHANAIDYHPEFDQVLLSNPFINEVWIIDHSTTTAEAAGHTGGNSGKGGDLLYRWGNPEAYGRGAAGDRKLFNQHDPEWIDAGLPGAGNILVFNNQAGGNFTTIDEIDTPADANGDYPALPAGVPHGPAAPTWIFTATPPTDLFAPFLSSSQRLPNGNTLICEGTTGEFLEIDTEGNLVWKYVNPITSGGPITQGDPATNNRVFRVERLAPDDPGLADQDLTPGDPLELFTLPLPVPDGTGITTPLIASRTTVAGDELNVQWDVSTCSAVDHNLIYGSLQSVSSYTIDGAECAIGAAGDHDWFGVPPGDLYFVIVGVDQTAVYESSWGDDGTGSERNGTAASAQCGASNKVITLTCP